MSIYSGMCKVKLYDISRLLRSVTISNDYSFGRCLEIQNNYLFWKKGIHFYSTKNTIIKNGDGIIQNLKTTPEETAEYILDNYAEQVGSLSRLFECSENTAAAFLLKYPFLRRKNMTLILQKYTTLIEAGIEKEEVMKDLWILRYSLDKLKERLALAKSMNFRPMKPWHLRCRKDFLHRLSRNKENDRLALSPYQSVTDYICERLGISESQVKTFAKKHPAVMRVKVAKLKEVIDFLYSEGFTASQIYNTPRILCHSLQTIQKRLSILRERDHEPYSLFILCKSQRNFDLYTKNLQSSDN